jgi:hypothetical protein
VQRVYGECGTSNASAESRAGRGPAARTRTSVRRCWSRPFNFGNFEIIHHPDLAPSSGHAQP